MKFIIPVRAVLSHDQQKEARKAINLAIFGRENCNVIDAKGAFVPHPDLSSKIERRLDAAHRGVACTHEVQLEVNLDPATGELTFHMAKSTP